MQATKATFLGFYQPQEAARRTPSQPASVYAAVFESWRRASWWLGAAIGLVHALYVLVVAMPALPAMHPRMANEQQGTTPTKQLGSPGFMALTYGRRTPLSVILAHLVYGGILGMFYRLK
jgi:hypothetical protein